VASAVFDCATISALLGAMVSFQVGAAVAKQLFAILGTPATVAARLGLASLMLCIIGRPPWRMRSAPREVRPSFYTVSQWAE
jgi:inner membrane transporter RhtA